MLFRLAPVQRRKIEDFAESMEIKKMNVKDVINRSVTIIYDYYNNDLRSWFDSLAENAAWYGHAIGQVLEGRQNIIDAWTSEENTLTFSLGNVAANAVNVGTSCCEVIMTYNLSIHFPTGKVIPLFQRTHLTWTEEKTKDQNGKTVKTPKIIIADVSFPIKNHENSVYPKHFNGVLLEATNSSIYKHGNRIYLHGDKNARYFAFLESIMYIESVKALNRCIVHAVDKTYKITESLADIEKKYPNMLLRTHIGYLVNPNYVRSIHRFKLIMSNGDELPIPEKKYTAVKRYLKELQ